MNPITDVIFSITWILLLLWAIRTIVGGWKFVSEDAARPRGAWTTQVTKKIHPEMEDIKSGEQLLVFKPESDQEDDDEGDVIIIRK